MPYRSIPWPRGSGPNWQNHRFRGTGSFVVELPAGRPSKSDVERHVTAILQLTQ